MAEYIEREAIIKICKDAIKETWNSKIAPASWACAYADFIDIIEGQPAADVTPVVHAKWIPNTEEFTPKKRCTNCGYNKPIAAGERLREEPEKYCPNCGAKMDGGA